jgi:hypothetical protein
MKPTLLLLAAPILLSGCVAAGPYDAAPQV